MAWSGPPVAGFLPGEPQATAVTVARATNERDRRAIMTAPIGGGRYHGLATAIPDGAATAAASQGVAGGGRGRGSRDTARVAEVATARGRVVSGIEMRQPAKIGLGLG